MRATIGDLLGFVADRLKVLLKDRGVTHDLIDAVYALGNQDDLVLLVKRVDALQNFLGTEDGKNLLAGAKRAANILAAEEKKGTAVADTVDPTLFETDEERALFAAVSSAEIDAAKAIAAEDYPAAMGALAKLRGPVDAFFEAVLRCNT